MVHDSPATPTCRQTFALRRAAAKSPFFVDQLPDSVAAMDLYGSSMKVMQKHAAKYSGRLARGWCSSRQPICRLSFVFVCFTVIRSVFAAICFCSLLWRRVVLSVPWLWPSWRPLTAFVTACLSYRGLLLLLKDCFCSPNTSAPRFRCELTKQITGAVHSRAKAEALSFGGVGAGLLRRLPEERRRRLPLRLPFPFVLQGRLV